MIETKRLALIFDLDGTLRDAIEPIKDAWNVAMEEHNLSYRFDYTTIKSFMGLTPKETIDIAFKDVSFEKGQKYFEILINKEIEYLKTHPGKLYQNEESVLKELNKKYDLFIVSNSDKGYIENYLNYFNFNKHFKDHLCAGDTKLEKYQNILLVKEKYRLNEVFYIGDTLKDKIESEKANVNFIHAKYGFGNINSQCLSINSLDELPNLIEKVRKRWLFK